MTTYNAQAKRASYAKAYVEAKAKAKADTEKRDKKYVVKLKKWVNPPKPKPKKK